jgi:hypothetical protein
MPGSFERGIETVRRYLTAYVRTGGSALREPWLLYQKINERKTRSRAKVAAVLPIFVSVVRILRRKQRPEARIKTCH